MNGVKRRKGLLHGERHREHGASLVEKQMRGAARRSSLEAVDRKGLKKWSKPAPYGGNEQWRRLPRGTRDGADRRSSEPHPSDGSVSVTAPAWGNAAIDSYETLCCYAVFSMVRGLPHLDRSTMMATYSGIQTRCGTLRRQG